MSRFRNGVLAAVAAGCGWSAGASPAAAPAQHAAHLSQAPLVMRLDKDQFRIAFGIDAKGCLVNGCTGVIHYLVTWKTDDGRVVSELKRVSYSVPARYRRVMTVDRQYFDTAEGAHTTELIRVTAARITCQELGARTAQRAVLAGEL